MTALSHGSTIYSSVDSKYLIYQNDMNLEIFSYVRLNTILINYDRDTIIRFKSTHKYLVPIDNEHRNALAD